MLFGLGAVALAPRPLVAASPSVPVIDLHVDLPYRSLYKQRPFELGSGQFVARDLLASGVVGAVLPLYVPLDAEPHGRSRYQLERSYAHVFGAILRTPPYALPGCNVGRANGQARTVATWLAFEGASPIGGDVEEVRRWALRGVRSFGLVHSVPNRLSGSSGAGADPEQGLSEEGRRFVRAVFAADGLVDVSHASRAATLETIALGKREGHPVIATHSNALALAPHPRNLDDEAIRGIAATGGVIGVNFHRSFLRRSSSGSAGLAEVAEQMRYLARIGGHRVVAIGSDFEGGIVPAQGLENATRFQRLGALLRKSGWTEGQLRLAFFENAERVLCPKTAASQASR